MACRGKARCGFVVSCRARRIAKVSQPAADGSEAIFKLEQAAVIEIGAAKINLAGAFNFAFFDQFPKKKRHAGEMMEFLHRSSRTYRPRRHGGATTKLPRWQPHFYGRAEYRDRFPVKQSGFETMREAAGAIHGAAW